MRHSRRYAQPTQIFTLRRDITAFSIFRRSPGTGDSIKIVYRAFLCVFIRPSAIFPHFRFSPLLPIFEPVDRAQFRLRIVRRHHRILLLGTPSSFFGACLYAFNVLSSIFARITCAVRTETRASPSTFISWFKVDPPIRSMIPPSCQIGPSIRLRCICSIQFFRKPAQLFFKTGFQFSVLFN